MNRPNKETALKILSLADQPVTAKERDVPIHSSDGQVYTILPGATQEAVFLTTPEALGWTQAELDDPTITE
ncbi:hypothetical protein [Kocuria sp. HSID16901]|uniref:hypothetical protein n=1 Tax=Kocuria sp. HSID16901 TaxID=2419505 RepID=UPI000660BED3|nr:hypothetical protein [Kocuria sp. HSID16901]RUQ19689.1 hypothetical protein D8M21_11050 [Kocuria sp. HSID16901]RUQ22773.1 hypothetical protein D8M21_05030 [Kocuria sp. HSID16901]